MTGILRADHTTPALHAADGPSVARLAAGYLDGVHPSLIATFKNRPPKGNFNLTEAAYTFTGSSITQQWVWDRANITTSGGHQTRIIDVDQDGRDEVCEIGFCLNPNGTLRQKFSLSDDIRHSDRWYIGDFDQSRPGLEGYGIHRAPTTA